MEVTDIVKDISERYFLESLYILDFEPLFNKALALNLESSLVEKSRKKELKNMYLSGALYFNKPFEV